MNPEKLLSRIRVVLCRPSHPGNIGAAARAMKTMGLSRLCLVAPKQFPDPEADARATDAVDVLAAARICNDLDEALAGTVFAVALSARPRDLGPLPKQAREAVVELLAAAGEGDEVALVFGNETMGLSNEELRRCHLAATVPANPEFTSLNLGAAVQVLCYEARMAAFGGRPEVASTTTPFSSPLATHDEVEGLYAHLERVMTDTGFYNPAQPGRLMPKLRRLFGRARLEKDEINILRGILAATQEKTGYGRKP
ncbi:MAG: methyltransferase TrmH, group 1 [Rhodocyclaceae bacterium]|nr:methyltransferase TrmH, group 1 [Rhodocyclaceae bacterium]